MATGTLAFYRSSFIEDTAISWESQRVLLPLSHLCVFSTVNSWSCDPPEAENLDRNCNKVDSFNCHLYKGDISMTADMTVAVSFQM